MGVEPYIDLEFPKWDLGLVGDSAPGATTQFLVLLVLALVSLWVSALLLWLFRSELRSRAFPFFRLRAPSLECADAELARAHAQYLCIWRALDRKDFSSNLRELLRQADERVAAQELALERASKRVELGQLNRMKRSVSRVREALARKATRYCERLVGAALPLPEAIERLRTADPRRLSRGVALRAMVVVGACLLCFDRGATVSPLLDYPVMVVLWGPMLFAGGIFVGSALLGGPARIALTVLSLLTVVLLLGLSATFVWPASLAPVVAMAMFWAASRLLLRLSARGPVGVAV